MIRPAQQDEVFLADVGRARREEPDGLHVWWLGQSGFLVQWQGRHLLFDPYLSDSLTKKYAATDKPHVRLTERVVAPERLDFIEVATASHNHTDHLDGETLKPLFGVNPGLRLVLPAVNREFARERLGGHGEALEGLAVGERREVAGFVFTGLPAAHEEERPEFMGFGVEAGPWRIYHSGDTLVFPRLVEALREFGQGSRGGIDVAFLPVNGRAPERRVAGNMDGREAAQLAQAAGIRLAVPCHYGMFAFNTASPEGFATRCRELGQAGRILEAGERFTLGPK